MLYAGEIEASNTRESSPTWAFEYMHPVREHFAVSFAWLNEGHIPGHHRDGQSVQLWGRTHLLGRRLLLAAGIGPYHYFDTTVSTKGDGYANAHGWGLTGSLAATWYTDSRWLYQLRVSRIVARDSFDTRSMMMGVGYQLEPVATRGPQRAAPPQRTRTTDNEITLFVGSTIVNSFHSERSAARALEFRRGLGRHVDVTVGILNEGSTESLRRTGISAQLWGVREVLASDRLVLGVGFGPYLAVKNSPRVAADASKLSWIFTAAAAYRIDEDWIMRVSWNRTGTDHDQDTDVVLLGIGYQF